MENINVRALVKLIGINENTLRAWERRYQAVTPQRDSDGRRLYSAKDIERLRCLAQLVKDGHSIGRIAHLPTAKLKKMLEETAWTVKDQLPKEEGILTQNYNQQIIAALKEFDLERLHHILQRVRFEKSPRDIIFEVVTPLLSQVGELVMDQHLSIAQEHMLSSLLRDYLGQIYQSLSPYEMSSRLGAKKVLITTREGDLHEFGILMVAIICNLHRMKVHYLGPNMPVFDIIQTCHDLTPDIVICGFSKIPQSREIITPTKYLRELDQELNHQISFFIGGNSQIDIKQINTNRKIMLFSSLVEIDQYLTKL